MGGKKSTMEIYMLQIYSVIPVCAPFFIIFYFYINTVLLKGM